MSMHVFTDQQLRVLNLRLKCSVVNHLIQDGLIICEVEDTIRNCGGGGGLLKKTLDLKVLDNNAAAGRVI